MFFVGFLLFFIYFFSLFFLVEPQPSQPFGESSSGGQTKKKKKKTFERRIKSRRMSADSTLQASVPPPLQRDGIQANSLNEQIGRGFVFVFLLGDSRTQNFAHFLLCMQIYSDLSHICQRYFIATH